MTDPSGAFLAPISTTLLARHLVNLVLVREQLMKVVSFTSTSCSSLRGYVNRMAPYHRAVVLRPGQTSTGTFEGIQRGL